MEDKKFKISDIDSSSRMALILNELLAGAKAKINAQGIFEELSELFPEEHHEHIKNVIDKTEKKTLSSMYKILKNMKKSILDYLKQNCIAVDEDDSKTFYMEPLDEKLEKEMIKLETSIASSLKKKEADTNKTKTEIKELIGKSMLFMSF